MRLMTYRFDFRRYRLPLRIAVRTAHGIWTVRDGVVVRLENEAGAIGFGEAAPLPWFGTETADEVEAACREIGERVELDRLLAIPDRLGCLQHAIEAALRLGEPAVAIKRGDEVDVTLDERTSYLSVAGLLPAGRTAVTELRTKSESGFRVFKWKVGVGDLSEELGVFDDLCGELPGGAKLRLDANGAWNRRQAERWLERCAERPVEYVEQPCFAGKTETAAEKNRTDDSLRGLAADYPTPLALDESLVGDKDVEKWLGAGWSGIFVVKPSLFGATDRVLQKLAAAKADVVFSSSLETAIGARAALEHAFAWRGGRRAIGFGVYPLFADGRFDGPLAAPFVRREDIERLNAEAVWNALS